MKELNIVSFNIRCFGFDGDYYARHRIESRLTTLKTFIELNYSDVDVFILQEIMDLELVHKILPEGFKTYHYAHEYERHMFVVLACKEPLNFSDLQIVPNTTLDETTSRPAIYGQLNLNKTPIAHILGVHLKSGFEHTDKRIFQCEQIGLFLEGLKLKLPVIMGGDFNSHFKTRTSKKKDDLEYLQALFEKQLTLVEHHTKTYVLPTEIAQLDHFWIQSCKVKSIQVYDVMFYAEGNALKNYYREISDHLPVQLKVEIRLNA